MTVPARRSCRRTIAALVNPKLVGPQSLGLFQGAVSATFQGWYFTRQVPRDLLRAGVVVPVRRCEARARVRQGLARVTPHAN